MFCQIQTRSEIRKDHPGAGNIAVNQWVDGRMRQLFIGVGYTTYLGREEWQKAIEKAKSFGFDFSKTQYNFKPYENK